MNELSIQVTENIAVRDIFGTVAAVLRRVLVLFAKPRKKKWTKKPEQKKPSSERAPPTLGVKVQENIDMKDIFGR